MEEESKYYWMDLNARDHLADLAGVFAQDELYGIVDRDDGIIAYAIGHDHAEQIVQALRRQVRPAAEGVRSAADFVRKNVNNGDLIARQILAAHGLESDGSNT